MKWKKNNTINSNTDSDNTYDDTDDDDNDVGKCIKIQSLF